MISDHISGWFDQPGLFLLLDQPRRSHWYLLTSIIISTRIIIILSSTSILIILSTFTEDRFVMIFIQYCHNFHLHYDNHSQRQCSYISLWLFITFQCFCNFFLRCSSCHVAFTLVCFLKLSALDHSIVWAHL